MRNRITEAVLVGWALLTLAGPLITPVAGASEWTENSFADFRDGTFTDAGSNAYVSAKGRIQIINRWDLNNDGHLDVIMPGGHAHSEKENTYIYLNTGKDIDGRSLIELPGSGSSGGLAADFNKDGLTDLAVVNASTSHNWKVDAFVYYGTPNGFSVEKRAELPAYRGLGLAVGDFNADGWLDLALACNWVEEGAEASAPGVSFVYWNSAQGFDPKRRTPLFYGGSGAQKMASADVNADGHDDLLALTGGQIHQYLGGPHEFGSAEHYKVLDIAATHVAFGKINKDDHVDMACVSGGGLRVHYGSDEGFSTKPAADLKISSPSGVAVADFDGDGLDDVAISNYAASDGAMWTSSYLYYSDGADFSTRKPLALSTCGASSVAAGDLNGDGKPELVLSNLRVTNFYDLVSFVYWNHDGELRDSNRSQLSTRGAVACAIGDMNNDKLPDVIFFNQDGGFRDGPVDTVIYWGSGKRDFSRDRSLSIPGFHYMSIAHADLEDDGKMDLILCQTQLIYQVRHEQAGLRIHWGSSPDYHHYSSLLLDSTAGVRVADLNRDGWLDLIAGGDSIDLKDPKVRGLTIFWGSEKGYAHGQRTVIPTPKGYVRCPLVMDLNRDGWLDLTSQIEPDKVRIWWGNEAAQFSNDRITDVPLGQSCTLMYIKGADLNRDGWLDLVFPVRAKEGVEDERELPSFIYYGSSDGFSIDRRTQEIAIAAPYENAIADVDRDGWLDLIFSSYAGEVDGRNKPSPVYYGGPNGFAKRPRAQLPTYASSGAETADYDGDGWIDILFSNHRRNRSTREAIPTRHVTESMLYWGGSDGFSAQRRWDFESRGPSGMNVRDPGNSYDRGLYEDYISSPHLVPSGEKPASIAWVAETPHNTAVQFQVRCAPGEADLKDAKWIGPDNPDSWFTQSGASLSNVKGLDGQWIQYRTRLMTPNGGPTPYITSVTVSFQAAGRAAVADDARTK